MRKSGMQTGLMHSIGQWCLECTEWSQQCREGELGWTGSADRPTVNGPEMQSVSKRIPLTCGCRQYMW